MQVEVDGTDRTPAGKRDRALVAMLALTPGETVGLPTRWRPGCGARWCRPAVRSTRWSSGYAATAPGRRSSPAPTGLRLVVDAADVDALEAERLADLARDQAANQQPWEALDSLDQALAAWRGPVLSGVDDVPFARPVVERFDELRHTLTEERFELLFRLNRAAQAIDELRAATREHPTRERTGAS